MKQSWLKDTLLLPATVLLLVVMQIHVFARAPSAWLKLDLVTILVFWCAFELRRATALAIALWGAFLMETHSNIKPGFYLMYYCQLLVMPLLQQRVWLDPPPWARYAVFPLALLLKEFWLYLLFSTQETSFPTANFLATSIGPFLGTCAVLVPVYLLVQKTAETLGLTLRDADGGAREQAA